MGECWNEERKRADAAARSSKKRGRLTSQSCRRGGSLWSREHRQKVEGCSFGEIVEFEVARELCVEATVNGHTGKRGLGVQGPTRATPPDPTRRHGDLHCDVALSLTNLPYNVILSDLS